MLTRQASSMSSAILSRARSKACDAVCGSTRNLAHCRRPIKRDQRETAKAPRVQWQGRLGQLGWVRGLLGMPAVNNVLRYVLSPHRR